MLGRSIFYRAFKKLQKFLCTPVEADPRIHVLTDGECTQLPPYFEKYLFEAPAFLVDDSASALPIIQDYRYTVKAWIFRNCFVYQFPGDTILQSGFLLECNINVDFKPREIVYVAVDQRNLSEICAQ